MKNKSQIRMPQFKSIRDEIVNNRLGSHKAHIGFTRIVRLTIECIEKFDV